MITMRAPIFSLLAGALALLPLSVPADDADVNVRLQRPMKVGQRFNEVTTARYEQVSGLRGPQGLQNERRENWTIHFEADQEVLETTPRGSPKAYRLEFKFLTRQQDPSKKTELLPPGTVVIARATPDGGATFALEENGEELEDTLQVSLSDLFGVSHADDSPPMDDLYATAGARKLGQEWPMDEAVARKIFGADDRLLVGISGGSRLIDKVEVDGVPCYRIGTAVSTRSRSNLRWAGVVVGDESEYLSAMLLTLPADNTSMERGYRSMKRHRFTGPADADNANRRSEITVYSTYKTDIHPLPPAPPRESKNPEAPAANPREDEEDEAARPPAGGES